MNYIACALLLFLLSLEDFSAFALSIFSIEVVLIQNQANAL